MRISMALFSLLLLLISGEFIQSLAVRGAHAVRIPEHTCRKMVGMADCDLQTCSQECSKESLGVGECRDNNCYCTYYCKQPPM